MGVFVSNSRRQSAIRHPRSITHVIWSRKGLDLAAPGVSGCFFKPREGLIRCTASGGRHCSLLVLLAFASFLLLPSTFFAHPHSGTVSWYSRASVLAEGNSGVMANGQALDDQAFTAASWDYPFNTPLRITGSTGTSVTCVVTDRGPARKLYRAGRILDLSQACFQALAPLSRGVIPVTVEQVE